MSMKSKSSNTIKQKFGFCTLQPMVYPEHTSKYPVCHNSSILGVEVEVENVPDPLSVTGWTHKNDGSLRNHGVEYVCFPTRSKDICLALENLFKKLPTNAEFTKRTSIHVHLNVRVWTFHKLKAFLLTYLCIEPLLFKFVGAGRDKNINCIPIHDGHLIDNLDGLMTKNSLYEFSIINDWCKYSALNILPISTLGTVEFRHMHGTRDLEKIMQWINFILRLKNWAYFTKSSDVINEILKLNATSEYAEFVKKVFNEDAIKLIYPGFEKDMEMCVSNLKEQIFKQKLTSFFKNTYGTDVNTKVNNIIKLDNIVDLQF